MAIAEKALSMQAGMTKRAASRPALFGAMHSPDGAVRR